jgi:hypothetical protein
MARKVGWIVGGIAISLLISTVLESRVQSIVAQNTSKPVSTTPSISSTQIPKSLEQIRADEELQLKKNEYTLKANAQVLEQQKIRQAWLTIVLTGVAGVGFWVNHLWEKDKFKKEKELSEKKLTSERLSKAIDNLAGKQALDVNDANDINDDITIRIGGIYALQGIESDSPEMSVIVMNILSSYVRRYSKTTNAFRDIFNSITVREYDRLTLEQQNLYVEVSPDFYYLNDDEKENRLKPLPPLPTPTADIMTALFVLGRLKNRDPERFIMDLHHANLRNVPFVEANLSNVALEGANLSDAILFKANLTNAYLSDANLMNADLTETNLTGAHLSQAHMKGADLTGATYNTQPVKIKGLKKILDPTEFPSELGTKAKRDARGMVEKNSNS